MSKRKSSAVVLAADGSGGMRELRDLRFEAGDWPFESVVLRDEAAAWMAQLAAETEERGWTTSTLSQADRAENSGTITAFTVGGASDPVVEILWERGRNGDLRVRARPGSAGDAPLVAVDDFVQAVAARHSEHRTTQAPRRALMTYQGLPWRGELWLSPDLRLGPPSRFPEALIGPQILTVDATCDGIGEAGVTARFQILIHELRVFLGIVLGIRVQPVRAETDWVLDLDSAGRIEGCSVRPVGYIELSPVEGSPAIGSAPPVERREVQRPGFGQVGIWSDMEERWVPDDIEALWSDFLRLPPEKRTQLLGAGNAYLIAGSLARDQRTASATFLVVACEALKPRRKRDWNVFDVVTDLLGEEEGRRLRLLPLNPLGVRDKHLHHGDLAGGELLPLVLHDYFADPSFDEMIDELWRIARTCLVEWVRREAKKHRS